MSDKIMCQAKDGDSGADGIAPADAEALQSISLADAKKIANAVAECYDWPVVRGIFSSLEEAFPRFAFEIDSEGRVFVAETESREAFVRRNCAHNFEDTYPYCNNCGFNAAYTQSKIEERSDEVEPKNKSASLTQNRNSIIEQCAKLIDEQAQDAFDTSTHSRDAMTIYAYETVSTAFHAAAKELRSLKSPKEPA